MTVLSNRRIDDGAAVHAESGTADLGTFSRHNARQIRFVISSQKGNPNYSFGSAVKSYALRVLRAIEETPTYLYNNIMIIIYKEKLVGVIFLVGIFMFSLFFLTFQFMLFELCGF